MTEDGIQIGDRSFRHGARYVVRGLPSAEFLGVTDRDLSVCIRLPDKRLVEASACWWLWAVGREIALPAPSEDEHG